MPRTPFPQPRTWPFFSTPPAVFAAVMGPLTAMMVLLAVPSGMPLWVRISASLVAAISLYATGRGYLCRVQATGTHIHYQTPFTRLSIPWAEVRDIDAYVPVDRNLTTKYVYITRRSVSPVDRREIDRETLQLQDRPGLVEELRAYWRAAVATPNGTGDSGSVATEHADIARQPVTPTEDTKPISTSPPPQSTHGDIPS